VNKSNKLYLKNTWAEWDKFDEQKAEERDEYRKEKRKKENKRKEIQI